MFGFFVIFTALPYLHVMFKYNGLQSITCKVVLKNMKIISEVNNQQDFNELKSTMEVFIVTTRIKQLAEMA